MSDRSVYTRDEQNMAGIRYVLSGDCGKATYYCCALCTALMSCVSVFGDFFWLIFSADSFTVSVL